MTEDSQSTVDIKHNRVCSLSEIKISSKIKRRKLDSYTCNSKLYINLLCCVNNKLLEELNLALKNTDLNMYKVKIQLGS